MHMKCMTIQETIFDTHIACLSLKVENIVSWVEGKLGRSSMHLILTKCQIFDCGLASRLMLSEGTPFLLPLRLHKEVTPEHLQ